MPTEIGSGPPSITAEDLAEFAGALHDEPTLIRRVDKLLEHALRALDCDYAGVIFVHAGGRTETVSATDPLIEKLDSIQMECGEGPDVDVIEGDVGVVVTDTHSETRWPQWARMVAAHEIRSLVNARLSTTATTIGTLNFYAHEANRFNGDDHAVAQLLARHASVALAGAKTNDSLMFAVDARKQIGQAQGILMQRFSLNADQAFALLMRYSQKHQLKVLEVARQLILDRDLLD